MPKWLKYIIFASIALMLLVFGIPFTLGFVNTFNPKKSIELGKQKAAEYANIYIPVGYTLVQKANWRQTKEGDLFITKMTKGQNVIQIIQSDEGTTCRGKKKNLAGVPVCYFDFGTIKIQPNQKVIMWHSKNSFFQLSTNDKALTEKNLARIIASLQ